MFVVSIKFPRHIRLGMEVTLHYADGTESDFTAESIETVNDVAYVDGVLHTDVQDVSVEA